MSPRMDGVPDDRRRMMSRVRDRNTRPEITVRQLLHASGYRFRLHRHDLPGRPDIVFPTRRKAIEIRGCFWHRHPGCRDATIPRTRREWWEAKLTSNVERDARNLAALEGLGWQVLVLWECELGDVPGLAMRLGDFLGPPGRRGTSGGLGDSKGAV